MQSIKHIKLLLNSPRVNIYKTVDGEGYNCIDYSAIEGNITIFRLLLLTLMERQNVHNWKGIFDNSILTEDIINKWITLGNTYKNDAFVGYIVNLQRKAYEQRSYSILYSMIIDDDARDENKTFADLAKIMRSAQFLYDNCDKNALINVCTVINFALCNVPFSHIYN